MKLITAISFLSLLTRATAESGGYWNRVATFPTCLQLDETCNLDNYTAAYSVSATTEGITAIYTDPFLNAIGFANIEDPSNPSPEGYVALPGKPTTVVVKDDNYAVVVIATEATGGQLSIIDLASKEIVREIDLGGEPTWMTLSPDKRYAVVTAAAAVFTIDTSAADPMSWSEPTKLNITGLSGLTTSDELNPAVVSINEENKAIVSLPKNNGFVIIDIQNGEVLSSFTQGSVDLVGDFTANGIIDQTESKSGVSREGFGVAWIGTEYFASANKGARSFSIFSADGAVVYDSGNEVQDVLTSVGHYADHLSEGLSIAVENVLYADDLQELFLNSEGGHVTIVYDVSDPSNPVFKQVLPSGFMPEGSTYHEERKLLLTATEFDERGNKVRGALIVYEYGAEKPQYPTVMSNIDENGLRIPWSALSGMSADPISETTLYTVNDSAFKKSQIFTIDTSGYAPAEITKAVYITDPNGVIAATLMPRGNITAEGIDNEFSADDIASMVNDDNTVNIDQEGIVAVPDGFWIATEGSGTIDDPKRPIKSLDLLWKTDKEGVLQEVVTLPDEVNDIQLRFGFEGVTIDGEAQDGENVIVAFQRAWGDEDHPRIGIYNTVEKTWKFAFYPLDTSESQLGGWVGLSDISNAGNGHYLVLERDNQGGLDSAIKRIYSIVLGNVEDIEDGTLLEKTLVMDLAGSIVETGAPLYEKLEGLAYTPSGDVWLSVDNDGVEDVPGETQLWNLGKIYDADVSTTAGSDSPESDLTSSANSIAKVFSSFSSMLVSMYLYLIVV